MANARRFEWGISPQLDTVVRSLSTLRKPVPSGRPGDGHQAILKDVQDAVRATPATGLRRVASPESNRAFQPQVLLSLLVYCYVTGTYSSADIEAMMWRDVTFRRFCKGEIPSARLLQRFRRKNRAVVRDCVYAVLLRQNQRCARLYGDRGSTCSLDALEEDAVGRVLKAMFIDRVEGHRG